MQIIVSVGILCQQHRAIKISDLFKQCRKHGPGFGSSKYAVHKIILDIHDNQIFHNQITPALNFLLRIVQQRPAGEKALFRGGMAEDCCPDFCPGRRKTC